MEGRRDSLTSSGRLHFHWCEKNEGVAGNAHLGQDVVNLGVHQSSSVSVLGHTENFSADLQRSHGG